MLEALGAPPDLDPTLLRPILHALRLAHPHRLTDAGCSMAGQVHLVVTDPIDETWSLHLDDGRWTFVEPGPDPTATATMTGDQTWRLLTNNLDPTIELAITGPPHVVAVLRRARAIIGHPRSRPGPPGGHGSAAFR